MEENIHRQFFRRETFSGYSRQFQSRNQVRHHFIRKLELESTLEGHTGCVNCLDWNKAGTILASGSDDTRIILWDPYRHKSIHSVDTQHQANIFSVKFMPQTGDHIIASGAADGHLILHDLVGKEMIRMYDVEGRIKRLVTTEAEPNIIISASEDGIIREYDTRQPSSLCARVLVDMTLSSGRGSECKSVAISPTNPNLFAVGSNDPYVRLYDRRMFDMHKFGTYFTPGHLRLKSNELRRLRNFCVTYVTFNSKGNELLVNLGGEQIYIFDIYDKSKPLSISAKFKRPSNGVKKPDSSGDLGSDDSEHAPKRHKGCSTSWCSSTEERSGESANATVNESRTSALKKKESDVRSHAFRMKGNTYFSDERYTAAIDMYNEAISLAPKPVVYSNRAAALIKRQWDGDFYAALKDCHAALKVNPADVKAHYRLARCMFELQWFEEAWSCMKEFKQHHPEHSSSNACVTLEKDITGALRQRDGEKNSKSSNERLTSEETARRLASCDYKHRYCGHCNTTTDIKEANFFGDDGRYIVAGSDEGSFFVWERETTNLVRVMHGDSSIVNCLQPHPTVCMLATSGIDPEVKLWSPQLKKGKSKHVVDDMESAADENQRRMNTDPLESMLVSMGMRFGEGSNQSEVMPCRPT